ncbi:MAG: BTAD domain-containing putative transcriptional regulator [Thermomicrobiales bacterium]
MAMDMHTSPAVMLRIQVLGDFLVWVSGQAAPRAAWRQRRAAAILKLLALERGHRLHREQVQDTLWPDFAPDAAANNLRGALLVARRALERAGAPPGLFLTRDGDTLVLGPVGQVQVDVAEFQEAASRAWHGADSAAVKRALAHYAGDLLPDDPYEEWAESRRHGLRATYLTLLERLAGLQEAAGDGSAALATRERALAADPLDEAQHAATMRLLARLGHPQLALARYADLVRLLQDELGARPEPATARLAEEIRSGAMLASLAGTPAAGQPGAVPLVFEPVTMSGATLADAPAGSRPQAPGGGSAFTLAPGAQLPAAVDALVGRERELADLTRLLTTARLITLTGPGGTGKTRLAHELARRWAATEKDPVALVDLAPLREADLVLPAIARALGLEESGSQPVAAFLAEAIGTQRLLLILDNLEQVAAAAPAVGDLLLTCPHLVILGASRVRLRLRGEQEYPVSPLAAPDPANNGEVDLDALAGVPAVELFLRRTQAARPGFTLDHTTQQAVAAICRKLDGLPLAIELAAAQMRVLTPEQLLHRLEASFDVLKSTSPDLPPRQRTLRETIAWSYDLLSSGEQRLFGRLGLFASGWRLEAVEAMATIGDEPPTDALETLAGLIDHSLVQMRAQPADAEARYGMLETIREYAEELARASPGSDRVIATFEQYLHDLLLRAEQGLRGPEQIAWLDRLADDHDNLRATMGAMLARGDGRAALDLAPRLWEFWRIRGYLAEGTSWLQRALAAAPDADPAARAAAEFGLGKLAIDLGDYEGAESHFRVSAGIWEILSDQPRLVDAWNALLIVKLNTNELAEAQVLGEHALDVARATGDTFSTATALFNLGLVARTENRLEEAVALLEEALALWRDQQNPKWIALTTQALGISSRRLGDLARARALFEESKAICQRQHNVYGVAVAVSELGLIALAQGEYPEAVHLNIASLAHFESIGAPHGVIESLEWIAVCLAAAGSPAEAMQVYGAAQAARDRLQVGEIDNEALHRDAGLAVAVRALGEATAQAQIQTGRSLAIPQAVEMAANLALSGLGRSAVLA